MKWYRAKKSRRLGGTFLRIDQTIREVLSGGGWAFGERYARTISALHAGNVPWDRYDTFHPLIDAHARDVICVDIETTGLTAGTPLFLIGVLGHFNGELRVVQLLARDYTEEAALLAHFAALLDASSVVVSFNGKSYDLPYIRDGVCFLACPSACNKRILICCMWRGVCGDGDCPIANCRHWNNIFAAESGARYSRCRDSRGVPPLCADGNAVQMRDILYHNALDLLTTTEVLLFALEGRGGKK